MLSRLHDERVFTSSDDVVFSASSSRALQRRGYEDAAQSSRAAPVSRAAPRDLRADEEFKSSSEDDAAADDELDDEEEDEDEEEEEQEKQEEEARRTAGLKFPMQSPRHIAASQSYLHRHHRRGDAIDTAAASPTSRRRVAKKLLGGDSVATAKREREAKSAVDASREFMERKINVQYHDRPMELVYMPTGEIRPRDECPPGLRLPPSSADTRRLLDTAPLQAEGREKDRHPTKSAFDVSGSSSTVPITRQNATADNGKWTRERPNAIRTKSLSSKGYNQKSGFLRRGAGSEDDEVSSGGGDTERPDEGRRQQAIHVKADHLNKRNGISATDNEEVLATTHERQKTGKRDSLRDLNLELQKEKKRVLEKTTHILEQQGKIQALQHQLQTLQDRVAGMEKELEGCAHREVASVVKEDHRVRELEHQMNALSDSLNTKDNRIRYLENQITQLKISRVEENDRPSLKDENKIARLRQREAALAKQLEDLMSRVTEFHSLVECWKVNSREALEGCEKRSDMLELLDQLWKDFPILICERSSKAQATSPNQESSTIAFLTKKLRQKEEELRVTHVKYVELKELCARQCIREADLQNFINEHRLRGNLVIRKSDRGETAKSPSRDQTCENDRRRGNSSKEFAHASPEAHSDSDEDNDIVVSKPKVFIDIKPSRRDDGEDQEPSPIEHVRLAPSPALAQRYRQQQLQQNNKQVSKTTTRAATVSSASRTLATTRHTLTPTTSSRSAAQKKASQSRVTPANRAAGTTSKAPSNRTPVASRRPSAVPLPSRPWV